MYYYPQIEQEDENSEYQAFVDKFKPKKTTDDCYTPQHIYDAVLSWVIEEYNLHGRPVVRPFYPGGDYENYAYPPDCVVIDNPPFSILAKIMDFYKKEQIDFFLFAPALTVLSSARGEHNAVITDSTITYENGAIVKTAFCTNMGEYIIHVSSELHDAIEQADEIHKREKKRTLPKYVYPDEVLTAATIQKIARYGQTVRFKKEDCAFVRAIDSQKATGKTIFGGGVLLSERATAERAAATRWRLSDRERQIIACLGGD